jgi:hypothetical protein
MNHFLQNPVKCAIYDPIAKSIKRTFVFLGDVPKNIIAACYDVGNSGKDTGNSGKDTGNLGKDKLLREFYGQDFKNKLLLGNSTPKFTGGFEGTFIGADDDFADIEELLNAAPRSRATDQSVNFKPGVEYVTDVHVFPEDKFSELKEKLYLATGIPAYRQHLFYIDRTARTTYQIIADGIYNVDIRNISDSPDKILDIPIDKSLYDLRNNIHVEAQDTFHILGDSLSLDNTVYLVDLAQFTARNHTQLLDVIGDSYQSELFYYGFIIKYWPQLTQECFHEYMQNESELQYKYPDLAKNKQALAGVYKIERDIITQNYKNNVRAAAFATSNVTLAITQMVATVSTSRILLNIRNLFDKLRVTRCIPEIHAYVEHENKRYMLRKCHIRNGSNIQFPSGALMKSGITIAISLRKSDQESFHTKSTISTMENEQSRYLFLNIWPNGRYYIRTVWNEEDELGFDDIVKIMKKFTDPIINGINSLRKYVFISGTSLPFITKQNINYQSLNICVFWKKVMLENTFKLVRAMWDSYMRARITGARNVQQFDKYEFMFRKGMHEFDTSLIDRIVASSNNINLTNSYAHLSNNAVKQKWDQNYDGRIVRMSHRTTDIRFEVSDIREREFEIFYQYIVAFTYAASISDRVKESASAQRSYKDVKKLRKLREQDPELYNLKKYGSKKVYSIICQNQRQPLIYTADELRSMSAQDIKKLTQYWNFTLNKPAYYGCPNKKYPHLSFMTGAHPKHYCLPCCNKKSQIGDDSRKQRANALCMQKHKFIDTDAEQDNGISRHIMSYGKDIDIGRLSKLPQTSLKNLLFDPDNSLDYYIYGVAQHVPGVEYVGVVYAIAEALTLDLEKFISSVLAGLKKMPGVFNTLLHGTLIEYFRDVDDLRTTISDLFIGLKMFTREVQKFKQWPELFIELCHVLFDVGVFTFIDEMGSGESVDLFVPDFLRNELLYLARHNESTTKKYITLMKKQNKYYPIFMINAEKYFKILEVAQRFYRFDDKIVQLLFAMVKYDTRNDESLEKPIDLTFIKMYCEKTGAKCVLKYINKHNLCYAVIIELNEGRLYVPIDYSNHIDDGIEISFQTFSRDIDMPYDGFNAFIKSANAYIGSAHKLSNDLHVYKLLTVQNYLKFESKIIGATVNGMLYYFNKYVKINDIPEVELAYDYTSINHTIMSGAKPIVDNRSQKIGEALYTNYQYQLFVVEFVNYLNNERNAKMRDDLKQLIKDTNFKKDTAAFRASLRKLLAQQPTDLATLQRQIIGFYGDKTELFAQMDNTIYEFDRTTMTRIRTLPRDELKAELLQISRNFCIERDIDTENIKFPNIYMPCGEMSDKTGYCDKGRLIINQSIDDFIDILATDLTDSLKSKYLLNSIWADTIIDWLTFTRWPTETITIYRLTE